MVRTSSAFAKHRNTVQCTDKRNKLCLISKPTCCSARQRGKQSSGKPIIFVPLASECQNFTLSVCLQFIIQYIVCLVVQGGHARAYKATLLAQKASGHPTRINPFALESTELLLAYFVLCL
jgi:hypothetical protein